MGPELLTAAEMRAIEESAMRSGAVTGLTLMERAGEGVLQAVFRHWPPLARAPGRALVLSGPGNNGGDGFVIARRLRERGWHVTVFLLGTFEALRGDARTVAERWARDGGAITPLAPEAPTATLDALKEAARSADLAVDALFGTGLTRPLDPLGPIVSRFSAAPRVVAVDLPSGLCADSGRVIGSVSIPADLTVSFHRRKRGHVLSQGPALSGSVRVADIGLDTRGAGGVDGALRVVDSDTIALPDLGKSAQAHKYDHGHALVLTGGFGRTGAARLAARAALRMGAGLVTLGAPGAAMMEVATQIGALMLTRIGDGADLAAALSDRRITALCLGPGLGLDEDRARLLATALESGIALTLDADAVTLLARDAGLFGRVHDRAVLTPHGGEFARLFPDIADALSGPAQSGPAVSRVDAAQEAAARSGAVVVLKGPDTVIAHPEGAVSVSDAGGDHAAPWLATAGSGDVLAGFVTGLLARGWDPFDAAEAAVWLHAECGRSVGPGLIAEDLPEALPGILRSLLG